MLYVISTSREYDSTKEETYELFETGSESFIQGNAERLARFQLLHGININNMHIIVPQAGSENPWGRLRCENLTLDRAAGYTLLCLVNDKFKLVKRNREIEYVSLNQLKKYTGDHKMTNCEIREGQLHTVNTYAVTEDAQFKQNIHKQYARYEALSTVLGGRMSFGYTIEGSEVKLIKYTGTNKNVIVPKFITSILADAFLNTGIDTITLEPGLKSIGSHAFIRCNLAEIVIPESVEFIGEMAFSHNERLLTKAGKYKKHKITILSEKTIVMDRYNSGLY